MTALAFTAEVARETEAIYEKVAKQYTRNAWETSIAPYIYEINRLKKEKRRDLGA